jgi:hypothetical protein
MAAAKARQILTPLASAPGSESKTSWPNGAYVHEHYKRGILFLLFFTIDQRVALLIVNQPDSLQPNRIQSSMLRLPQQSQQYKQVEVHTSD